MLLVDIAGLGYEIAAPMSTFFNLPGIGQEITLHTHLVVKEDAHSLYGFAKKTERSLFRSLLKVSGIGPKSALAVLSGMDSDAFVAVKFRSNDRGVGWTDLQRTDQRLDHAAALNFVIVLADDPVLGGDVGMGQQR